MCDTAATTTTTVVATTTVAAASSVSGPGTSQSQGTAAATSATAGATPPATTTAKPEQQQRARQNCCRLCIAPASECISIINSYAADKEPLSTKIHNCVNIKITPQDRLSLQICHACISYLNSWQSFKNRSVSAQTKQRQWLEANKSKLLSYLDLNSAENGGGHQQHQQNQSQQQHQQHHSENDIDLEKPSAAQILDGIPSLKKRKSLTVYPLPAIPIKDEPIDTDDDYQMKSLDESEDMVDPTMFLERSEHEGDIPLMTSDYDYTAQHGVNAETAAASLPPNAVANVAAAGDSKVASCRACSLQFSTRANARRHERNLHPNLFQLSTDSPNNTPITKPTPALAAALEIQRAAAEAATEEASKAAGAAGGNISTQKYRQVVMNAFIKCEGGGFNYDSPEQYQPLLTRDKVEFIEQNYEFLEQYQTMTCRCCEKYFTTYKNFMAHVRKKYPLLPRNLCFNCLKMNESKALFISHLKKRNCINLYRVLNALRGKQPNFHPSTSDMGSFGGETSNAAITSPTVVVPLLMDNSSSGERPEKLRAKELLVNKLYECKLCPKGFRTKHEFRTHVYDKHADVQRKDNNSIQCSFCGLDFADPVDRRRHYNNMDCIVRLRCMTCDAKVETHQRFLDHVYQDHLGGISSDNASTASGLVGSSSSIENSPGKRSLLGALGIGVCSPADESRSGSAAAGAGGSAGAAPNQTSTPKPTSGGGGVACTTPGGSGGSLNRDSAPKSQYFSRMPQVCPICGQQYNNYNNVLRHMESKHPNKLPETYKCVRCGLGYPRISYLREHMINVHGVDKNRHSGGFEYIVNADAVKLADGSTPNVSTGRYDYVMKDLMSITNDDDEEETGSVAKKIRLDDSSNNSSLVGGVASQQKECPICNALFSNNIGLSNHMRSHYTASNSVNAALVAANRMTPKSLTITATPATETVTSATASLDVEDDEALIALEKAKIMASVNAARAARVASAASGASASSVPPAMANQTPQEQAVFRRSLDQAADRRFRRMRCRICQRRFSSKKSYRYHMLTDHQVQNVQFIKCKLCNAEFAYEKGLKVHLFKVHGRAIKDEMIVKQFECDVCSIVYSSELELKQHKKSVHKFTSSVSVSASASASASVSASASTSSKMDDDSMMLEDMGGNRSRHHQHQHHSSKASADSVDQSIISGAAATATTTPLYWYQCKYCPSNFNTNKKLAIHINSHDEFDSNDYSCKDCGNVYSGRKSLWVHRYKKHPQVPDPIECTLCRKVFFDHQMLDNHTPTCNRKPITATGAHQQELLTQANQSQGRAVFRHKTGDDDDEEDMQQHHQQQQDAGDAVATVTAATAAAAATSSGGSSKKMRIPEVACTICGARFTDQEHFSKHIQKHEQDLYVDNPLAAMFDDGPADAAQLKIEGQNENGEYACDMCTKTFPQVIALKVHHKWHFRGDSKQNHIDSETTNINNNNNNSVNNSTSMLRELHAVGLTPNQQQQQQHQSQQQNSTSTPNNNNRSSSNNNNNSSSTKSKSMKRKRELKCEYCPSTFISNNNLRRHMYELHKHEVSSLPAPPVIVVDEPLSCRRCGDIQFETKELWIEHKLADAKVVRPFCPFQWGCDMCGEYLSRKEKLMNHINNHLKEDVIVPVATQAAIDRERAASSSEATTSKATSASVLVEQKPTGTALQKKTEENGGLDAAVATAAESVKAGEDDSEMEDVDSSDADEESSGTGDEEDDDDDDGGEDDEDDDDEEDELQDDDDDDDEEEEGEGEDEEGVPPPTPAAQLLQHKQPQQQQQQHKANNNSIDNVDDLVEEVNSSDDEEADVEVGSESQTQSDEDDDDEEDDEADISEEEEGEELGSAQPLTNGKSNEHNATPQQQMEQILPSSDEEGENENDNDNDNVEEDGGNADGHTLAIEDIIEEEYDEDDDMEEVYDDQNADGGATSSVSSSESESTSSTTSNSHSTGERRKKAGGDESSNPSFTCDLCQLCFDSQELLQSHIKSHFRNAPKISAKSTATATVTTVASATTVPSSCNNNASTKSSLKHSPAAASGGSSSN
ncbi:blast:Zinc finger protein hangover [Drosophila guanche]|uniref:Blast:Zinc finger protein hangover n=2 Tax=Drosophila guanche TaxID=7266 RepID=A0A3B0J788_DROGU|nr:blast:Zinc finger protein hangover [Drosophila guanche]